LSFLTACKWSPKPSVRQWRKKERAGEIFWVTSAVINAAVSRTVESRLEAKADEHVARLHMFYEFFSTMTGRGVMGKDASGQTLKILFDGNDAAEWLKEFSGKVTLVEIDSKESLDALAKAQSLSVQGAHVYVMRTLWLQ